MALAHIAFCIIIGPAITITIVLVISSAIVFVIPSAAIVIIVLVGKTSRNGIARADVQHVIDFVRIFVGLIISCNSHVQIMGRDLTGL